MGCRTVLGLRDEWTLCPTDGMLDARPPSQQVPSPSHAEQTIRYYRRTISRQVDKSNESNQTNQWIHISGLRRRYVN